MKLTVVYLHLLQTKWYKAGLKWLKLPFNWLVFLVCESSIFNLLDDWIAHNEKQRNMDDMTLSLLYCWRFVSAHSCVGVCWTLSYIVRGSTAEQHWKWQTNKRRKKSKHGCWKYDFVELWLFEYVIIIVNSLRIINLLHQFPDRRVFIPEEINIQIQTAMSVNTTLAAFDIS